MVERVAHQPKARELGGHAGRIDWLIDAIDQAVALFLHQLEARTIRIKIRQHDARLARAVLVQQAHERQRRPPASRAQVEQRIVTGAIQSAPEELYELEVRFFDGAHERQVVGHGLAHRLRKPGQVFEFE
ncbi:MAG: hypothetical protein QM756_00250 [Polyangiaceae bacterium]